MNEDYEYLLRKVENGTCTPLELFNIKMYVGIQAVGHEGLKRACPFEYSFEEKDKRDDLSTRE